MPVPVRGTSPSSAAGCTWTQSAQVCTPGLRGLLHKGQPRLAENQEEGLPGCGSASVCYGTRGKVSLKKLVCLHFLYIVSCKKTGEKSKIVLIALNAHI